MMVVGSKIKYYLLDNGHEEVFDNVIYVYECLSVVAPSRTYCLNIISVFLFTLLLFAPIFPKEKRKTNDIIFPKKQHLL